MKLGYSLPSNQGFEDPLDIISLAEKAEAVGLNSVWTSEHLFHSSYIADRLDNRPYYEPLSILSAVAMRTKTVRLGTTVIVLPWHDPPRLGKTVATLDKLSNGRVDLGVGVATTEDEYVNLGVDFKTRGKRANEILSALQVLWTQEIPEYSG
ncbi:MAG: LLM class flavin-dependent oxidoreductase, partial [Alphaproteobacteria bacterium]